MAPRKPARKKPTKPAAKAVPARKLHPSMVQDENIIRGLSEELYAAILDSIEHDPSLLNGLLENLHPADIADILERLPREHRQPLLGHVPYERLGDMISELDEGVRDHVLQLLNPEEVRTALEDLESDDAAEIARSLEDVLPSGTEDVAEDVLSDYQHKRLLHYDEDTAGGIMQVELVAATPTQTVGEILEWLRKNAKDIPAKPGSIFVVTPQRKLLGTVSISRLIRARLSAKLREIMRKEPLVIHPEQLKSEVISQFDKYDIHNLAVVNKRGQLLGRITIDDVLDEVMEESARQQARSVGLDENDDLFSPLSATTRQRLPWLLINLLTAVAAASVIALFESSIAQLTTLAVLMPIVASMGGNATTQTQTVIIRALALGKITRQNAVQLLKKEFSAGGYLGTILALLMALGTWLLYDQPMLAFVIAVATIINHLLAALGGYFIPLGLKRFGYDPAISSGVLTTTVTDVGGFFVFLALATLLLL